MGHRIRFIKSLLKWTHEEGYILRNPAAKLKEPKLGQRICKFLSKHEIEHFREGCHTSMEALFEFFSTGCRIREVAKLNKNDINFIGNSVIVHGKVDSCLSLIFREAFHEVTKSCESFCFYVLSRVCVCMWNWKHVLKEVIKKSFKNWTWK